MTYGIILTRVGNELLSGFGDYQNLREINVCNRSRSGQRERVRELSNTCVGCLAVVESNRAGPPAHRYNIHPIFTVSSLEISCCPVDKSAFHLVSYWNSILS